MTVSKKQFARMSSSEQHEVMNRLLKERTFGIARAELAPDTVSRPIPKNLVEVEIETNLLLSKAKKGSTVYKLLKLQIQSIKQTRRFEVQMEKLKAQEKMLKDKAKKLSR